MKRIVLFLVLAIGALSARETMAKAHREAPPRADIGFKSLGASVAYVSPENLDGTFGFGVFADLGRITPQIGLEPHIDYWSGSQEAFGAKAEIRDIAVGARGKYYFEVKSPTIRPFLGTGLALHFVNAKATVSVPGFPTVSSSSSQTKLGLDLGGGMETSLNPKMDLHAELWYGIVSDVGQFAVRLGVSRKLGQ